MREVIQWDEKKWDFRVLRASERLLSDLRNQSQVFNTPLVIKIYNFTSMNFSAASCLQFLGRAPIVIDRSKNIISEAENT